MILTQKLAQKSSLLRPIQLFKCVEIHLSTLVLIFFAILFDFADTLLVVYLIVVIHEFSHIATAIALHIKPEKIEIMPFGVTMKINSFNITRPQNEIKIAIAGPISNIVMAFIALALYYNNILSVEQVRFFITANCAIALINIVPALPLDGGRILKASLTQSWGYVKAFNFTLIITKITAILLTILGFAVLIITKFNFSILLISAFLIANIISENRGSKMIMMREILYSRQKLCQTGLERSSTITIMYNAPARKALKMLSYNKYYIIKIIDNDMGIIGSITETELIEGLINKGIRAKAIEIFDK